MTNTTGQERALREAAIRVRDNNRKGVTGQQAREAWVALNNALDSPAEVAPGLIDAARQVESWWLTEGMKAFDGAPACIFNLRAALHPLADKGADHD